MAYRWDIVPYVCEIQPCGIQPFTMPTVVLDITAAVSALENRDSRPIEDSRLAFGEVQKTVVGWIESTRNGQSRLNVDGDPMAKCQCT